MKSSKTEPTSEREVDAIMIKWEVDYYVRNKNLYTYKYVYANTAADAIKKARVKNITDLKPIEEERKEER